jgi:glycosyltransferase involved in cell wall biosynthesis
LRDLSVYTPAPLAVPNQPFGKDIANIELFRALARHSSTPAVNFLSHASIPPDPLRAVLLGNSSHPNAHRIATGSIFDPVRLTGTNVLLRGTPDLANLAWQRRQLGLDQSYSIAGVVHTIAPPALRRVIAEATLAPLYPWDAIICTSPAVRDNLAEMFDAWEGHLSTRFGVSDRVLPRPQLPLLPLGVDADTISEQVFRAGRRDLVRERLGVRDRALVLWLGRLSFFEKAFPQPMFIALERAAQISSRKLHFAMVGWFPGGEGDQRRYVEAAKVHAPSVDITFHDGSDRQSVYDFLAASDIFLSLVDNVQETFGIAPVEAMAAGLPVVASDWDGYRYTIIDGEQGFLVPTLGGYPGTGLRLLERHLFGIDSYQSYVGQLAQHTAVDIDLAACSIADLANDAGLRAHMGEAGRKRVQECFAWPKVVAEFDSLFKKLEQLRSESEALSSESTREDPSRSEPYSCFGKFATSVLTDQTLLVRNAQSAKPGAAELDRYASAWRLDAEQVERLLQAVSQSPCTFGELVAGKNDVERRLVAATVVWLAKLGAIKWSSPHSIS